MKIKKYFSLVGSIKEILSLLETIKDYGQTSYFS